MSKFKKIFLASIIVSVALISTAVILAPFIFLGSIWYSMHSYSTSGSLEPTREAIGGISSEEMKSLWLAQPAVESYELKIDEKTGPQRYGREEYIVNYYLEIKIKPGYVFTDREKLIEVASDSIWNINDKAPEGEINVEIHIPSAKPEPAVRDGEAETPTNFIGIGSNSTKFEEKLGPWTGGQIPNLDGLFRELDLNNPDEGIQIVPAISGSTMELYHRPYRGDPALEAASSCVFYDLNYVQNPRMGPYELPVTFSVYENGELIKTFEVTTEIKDGVRQPTGTHRVCYDAVWELKNISGKFSWPEAPGYSAGEINSWVGTDRGDSLIPMFYSESPRNLIKEPLATPPAEPVNTPDWKAPNEYSENQKPNPNPGQPRR